jgi:hypothetical protein
MTATPYRLREARDADELWRLLRLRYRLRAAGRANGLQPNEFEVDVDGYDLCAKHYAILAETDGVERLVGCQRIVCPHMSERCVSAHELALCCNGLRDEVLRAPKYPLPCMNRMPYEHANATAEHYRRWVEAGREIAEIGPLYLVPEVRCARFVVRATEVMVGVQSEEAFTGVLDARPSHTNFFARFGFEPIPEIPARLAESFAHPGRLLRIQRDTVPESLWSRVRDCADTLRSLGYVPIEF